MKIAVGIAHAAWCPIRREALTDLAGHVRIDNILQSETPESSEIWATRLWSWGAEQDADAVVYLNDDVELCDDFLKVVEAMWQGEPLSLHSSSPYQRTRWAKCYWMTGPAYVLSPEMTKDLLTFAEGNWDKNEDNVGTRWSYTRQRPFYSPIPCPVRHRTDIPSTLGYDDHPCRTTRFFQKKLSTDPAFWRLPEDVPLVQNPWFRP